MGTLTCGKYPGECIDEVCTLPGHMSVDAETYAGWGIDSLKMDGCNSFHTHEILDPAYEFMGEAMNKTGRPILYSCSWPDCKDLASIAVHLFTRIFFPSFFLSYLPLGDPLTLASPVSTIVLYPPPTAARRPRAAPVGLTRSRSPRRHPNQQVARPRGGLRHHRQALCVNPVSRRLLPATLLMPPDPHATNTRAGQYPTCAALLVGALTALLRPNHRNATQATFGECTTTYKIAGTRSPGSLTGWATMRPPTVSRYITSNMSFLTWFGPTFPRSRFHEHCCHAEPCGPCCAARCVTLIGARTFGGVVSKIGASGMLHAAGPGHFNDPDMLIIVRQPRPRHHFGVSLSRGPQLVATLRLAP